MTASALNLKRSGSSFVPSRLITNADAFLLKALASEYEMKIVIGPATVLVSVVITFAVSLLVGLMVSAKCRKIDMVDALKVPE